MSSTFINLNIFIKSAWVDFLGRFDEFYFLAKRFHFAKVKLLFIVILIGHINAQTKYLIVLLPDALRDEYMKRS